MSVLMSARKFYKVGERKSGADGSMGSEKGGIESAGESVKLTMAQRLEGRNPLARRDLNFEDFGEGEKRERKR